MSLDMKCAVILAISILNVAHCANILGIATLPSHSHHLWNEVLAVGLSDRGHNVTLLSHDPKRKGNNNYTVIRIEGVYEEIEKMEAFESTAGQTLNMDDLFNFMDTFCQMDLESEALQTLLSYPKDYKFDLILWDMTTGECLFPLIKRFGNPPIIGVSPYGMQPNINAIMGHHFFNYIPFSFSSPTDRVNFWERLQNGYNILAYNYKRRNYVQKMQKISGKIFGLDVDDFSKIERKIALALINTDPNFDFPQALPPNIIPVGGLQITPPKALPKDLKNILDEAKNGVIYFSLGSNLRPEFLPQDFIKSFSECFAKLPNTVLWKIDSDNQGFSKNIITRKWMPQSEILAHPNTKVFITHGGALGTQEAMYHGVPLIGIPFFLDQENNIEKLVHKGLGKKLSLQAVNTENVCAALKEILGNKMYEKNIKLLSAHVKDQETSPLDRAIFWVEYVLRHGTGEHLSLAARDMTLIEILNLDIILFAFAICCLPFILLCFCCSYCKTRKTKLKQK